MEEEEPGASVEGGTGLRIPVLVVGGIKSHVFGTIARNLREEGFEVMWHWDYEHGLKGKKNIPTKCRGVIVLSDLIPHRDSVEGSIKSSEVPHVYTERKWARMQQDLVVLKSQIPEFTPGIENPVPGKAVIRRRRRSWNQEPVVAESETVSEAVVEAIVPDEEIPHIKAPLQEPETLPMAATEAPELPPSADIPYDELKKMLGEILHSKDLTDLVEIMKEKHFVTRVSVVITPGERPKVAIRREIEDTL